MYCKNFDFAGLEWLKHRPDEELRLWALVHALPD
jgi:hypothetical protein